MNIGEELILSRTEVESLRTEYIHATSRTMTIARNSLILAITYVYHLEINNLMTVLGDSFFNSDNLHLITNEYRREILSNYSIYSRLLVGDISFETNNITQFRTHFYNVFYKEFLSLDRDHVQLYYMQSRPNHPNWSISHVKEFYDKIVEVFYEDNMIRPGVLHHNEANVRIVNGEWLRIKVPSDFVKLRGLFDSPDMGASTSSTVQRITQESYKAMEERFISLGTLRPINTFNS
jgi:hypothetical protein